jgi:phosphodiesterase/alkaline phosphatase D-like protein
MWYNGNNEVRPYIAGKPVKKGIIERRDELLDIIVNKSSKVLAILTGDEHNYALTEISPEMERYPENYEPEKIQLNRTIYQVNNGAAGAPYYAQEITPWTPWVTGFTTQNALVLFHINGKAVEMEVINPDTLEEVDRKQLR